MKKISILIVAVAAIVAGMVVVAKQKNSAPSANNKKLSIVTTIFPEYDWTLQILGEKAADAQVIQLLDNGVDLHSYQPTVQDIAKVSNADVFVYVGGESDEWVASALKSVRNKNMQVVNLLEVLGSRVKEEELVEGMQAEDEHEHEHEADGHDDADEDEHGHHHHDEDEVEYDEHVWLSLRNAQTLCAAIAEAICTVDGGNAALYRKNLSSYTKALSALDADYAAMVKAAPHKTVLFGDRFPFRYLVDDYNLSYYAAFVGCSAETEASFKTVIFLADKTDELSLPAIFTIEKSDGKIAKTILQNTKAKSAQVLTLDSMQSTTSNDRKAGKSYLSIMQQNLQALEKALN